MILFFIIAAQIATLSIAFVVDPSSQWATLPKTTSGKAFIDISAKGNELWAIDGDRAVYRFDSANSQWNLKENKLVTGAAMSGKPTTIGASPDGYALISTDASAPDYGAAYQWQEDKQAWKALTINLAVQVNAMSQKEAFAVAWGYITYLYSDVNVPTYKAEATSDAKWGALGTSGEHWYLNKAKRQIFRWNKTTSKYDEIPPPTQPGKAINLDVQCPGRAVLTTECGRVFTYSNGAWNKLPIENALRATVNYKSVIAITSDGETLSYDWSQACEDGSTGGTGGTGVTVAPCNCP